MKAATAELKDKEEKSGNGALTVRHGSLAPVAGSLLLSLLNPEPEQRHVAAAHAPNNLRSFFRIYGRRGGGNTTVQ